MATTTEVAVQATATPLPATLTTTRTKVIVENRGAADIWVGHTEASLAVGLGHQVAPNTSREFGGAPLWAIAGVTQGGGAGDTTIVTEYP